MKRVSLIIVLAFVTLSTYAQNEKKLLAVVSPDSINVFLKSYLEQNASQRFEDPTIPRFLITDRNDMFVFGIGGYVGAKMIFDYQGNNGAGFVPQDVSQKQFSNESLGLDMSSSRFFFKVLGRTKIGVTEAYIEAGFSGANNTLKLKKAYVNLFGFRVGLNTTAFTDSEHIPVICDNGSCSFNDRAVPMVEYSYLFKNGLRLQGGVEFSQATKVYMITGEDPDERGAVSENMPHPDYTLNAYFKRGNLHLYAGGILRVMQYYDGMDSEFKNKPGYAFQLGGNYRIGDSKRLSHRVFLQGQYEYMMSDTFVNIENSALSIIQPNRIGWTHYDYTRGIGGQVGYSMVFGDNSINLQASANDIFGHEKSGLPELYKWGFVTTANYMRTVFKYGTVGVEGIWGQHRTVGGDVFSDFRVVGLVRYNF